MTKYTAELIASGFTFPETARWHGKRQAFYFSDIDLGRLYELKEGGTPRLIYQAEDWLSGFAFDDADGFYITQAFKRKILHLTGCLTGTPAVTEFADVSRAAKYSVNDMIRGPDGSLYLGAVDYDAVAGFSGEAQPVRSPVLHISPNGSVSVGTDITFFPNGGVILPGTDTYYVGDSFDGCIYKCHIEPDGSLTHAEKYVDLPGEMPDGMAADGEGGIWVATHHRCLRIGPDGKITDEVSTGNVAASACALGGADGRTLLITASDGPDRKKLHAVSSGVLLTARVAVPGAGLPSLYEKA